MPTIPLRQRNLIRSLAPSYRAPPCLAQLGQLLIVLLRRNIRLRHELEGGLRKLDLGLQDMQAVWTATFARV